MMTKFRTWRRHLSPAKQLVVLFLMYWIYWFAATFLISRMTGTEQETIIFRLINALWMALVFTTVFHWKLVKAGFRGRSTGESA
ncbi:MAG: hypothetical protein EOO11_12950 [Chitinophagaceae bacterium]|nr:MAG: hypothetical protein EOO11_12950 [Chitinophagaceae bacterium]